MDYMTLKEAAEKWGVTPRRVNYCLFAIILIDYIFCELLYKVYISNALYEIEKGA